VKKFGFLVNWTCLGKGSNMSGEAYWSLVLETGLVRTCFLESGPGDQTSPEFGSRDRSFRPDMFKQFWKLGFGIGFKHFPLH
jgi:hypothetical protein